MIVIGGGGHGLATAYYLAKEHGVTSIAVVEKGGIGARREPNTRATVAELHDGLAVESQNRWPSLAFDVGAAASLFAPLFVAGF